jgi:hypothetical protein
MERNYSFKMLLKVMLFVLFYIILVQYFRTSNAIDKKMDYLFTKDENFKFLDQTRDFNRYNCRNRVRIGGKPKHIQNAPGKLWRIDGAWFVCLDKLSQLEMNNCTVLSFGIDHDYSFDHSIRYDYGCNIYSFDPFKEADIFKNKRDANSHLKNSYKIEIDEKWSFYRVGIIGFKNETKNENKIGWMIDLYSILELINQFNKPIDIFKLDIEGYEIEIIKNLDMDYACKYFKQFILETHFFNYESSQSAFDLLKKLETCFSLFHRDTRFFRGDVEGATGFMTEFQSPRTFKIELKPFINELDLANFLFTTGELYFINKNFVS